MLRVMYMHKGCKVVEGINSVAYCKDGARFIMSRPNDGPCTTVDIHPTWVDEAPSGQMDIATMTALTDLLVVGYMDISFLQEPWEKPDPTITPF